MPNTHRGTSILAIVLVLLAAVLVYRPGLSGDFLFDDFPNIVTNPLVHMEQLDRESVSRALRAYQPGSYGRPLATLWFGFDHLIGGKDPFLFKFSNLLVHLINTLLVFLLVRTVLIHPSVRWRNPVLAAGFIAALWAVHPLQVSSVLYIVQRMETLAATFTLLGLLVYLRVRTGTDGPRVHWGLMALSGVLAAVGLLSKETAILFPLFVLVMELTVLGFQGPGGRHRGLQLCHAAVFVVGCLGFALLIAPAYLTEAAYAGRDFSLWERLLSQPRALCLYLLQMLVPAPTLTPFYYDHFPPSRGLLAPWTTLASLLILAGLAVSAVLMRRRLPLYSLGIGWFFAAHALTSNVINLELVFEHRNYIALLGVVLAVAALLRSLASRLVEPRFAVVLSALLVLGFGGMGAIRSATWGDPFNLAMDLITLAPESSRAANDMATLYYGMADGNPDSPFFQFAMYEFERSRHLPNASIIPEQGLIVMAASVGAEVDPEWWNGLSTKIRRDTISPETLATLQGLLVHRTNGIEVGDVGLNEAVQTLLSRRNMPSTMHFHYGLLLLESETLQTDPMLHFNSATERGWIEKPELRRMALAFAERGHEAFANELLATHNVD